MDEWLMQSTGSTHELPAKLGMLLVHTQLQVAFAPFEGVRAIRLIRDRVTNQSRGFAFVEFADLEVLHVAAGLTAQPSKGQDFLMTCFALPGFRVPRMSSTGVQARRWRLTARHCV